MKQIIDRIFESFLRSGLVEVEVSARHVHLTQEDVEFLFGDGALLHEKHPLSQPGQFLSEERVNIIGTKGRKDRVAVLGPVRRKTQVELSISDCVMLGVKAPIRESGDLQDAGDIMIEGPKGMLTARGSVMVARAHVHVPPMVASMLELQDKQRVRVQVLSERPVTFDNVLIRVNDQFRYRMHIDFDEANAAQVSGFTLGKIVI